MSYNIKSLISKNFVVFFFLWGGGPNWCKDHALWCLEQEAEWTTVGFKSKKSFVDVVCSPPPSKKNSVVLGLNFPLDYHKIFVEDLLGSSSNFKSPTREQPKRVLRRVAKS